MIVPGFKADAVIGTVSAAKAGPAAKSRIIAKAALFEIDGTGGLRARIDVSRSLNDRTSVSILAIKPASVETVVFEGSMLILLQ
jgi:hypothetical protein